MTIPFNNVSSSYRASKNFIELAGVKRSLASLFIPPCGLIIGMYDTAKTSVVDYVPVKVTSANDVALKAGFGSHAHRQALQFPPAVFLQGNGVYWIPIPQASGTPADETVTFTGDATSSGVWAFLIAGDRITVDVTNGMTDDDQAAALVTAITAKIQLPVTATAAANVVTVTAKFDGTQGNQIKIVVSPAGESDEANVPATTAVTLENIGGNLDAGATDPDIEDAFFDSEGNDILGDRWYTHITMPFVDATTIGYYKTLAELRADPAVNRFFGAYSGYVSQTYSQALALPSTVNSEYIGQIFEDEVYVPDFELSARLVGLMLDSLNEAPSQPYKTLDTELMFNPEKVNRRYIENDALFRAGMSYCYEEGGSLRLGDIALTYRTDDYGADTEEWFDAVSLHRRQAKAYSIEQVFKAEKYQRGVVVDNAAVTKVSFAIAPKDIVADLQKLVSDLWVPYGWTKNEDEVLESIAAEINGTYESRIDGTITDNEAQSLRQIAIRFAYLY